MIFGPWKQRQIHAHALPNDKIPHVPSPEDAAFFRGTQGRFVGKFKNSILHSGNLMLGGRISHCIGDFWQNPSPLFY